MIAAVGLALSVTGFAVPAASAAALPQTGKLDPIGKLDSIAVSDLPAEHRNEVPKISDGVDGLNQLKGLRQLDELYQVAALVAPVTGLLPAVHG
ncbi:hypothetical protein ACFYXC_08325 [Streptomyces sp. NPDC002701]|uniref:hypothetical protein n=1 Tax=Streptomyces sp. NPDC002701 TaxID=3364661 RepID=UPI0036AAB50E